MKQPDQFTKDGKRLVWQMEVKVPFADGTYRYVGPHPNASHHDTAVVANTQTSALRYVSVRRIESVPGARQ